MSVVVALEHPGGVVIGADSANIDGNGYVEDGGGKLIGFDVMPDVGTLTQRAAARTMVVGYVGQHLIGQVLRHEWLPPSWSQGEPADSYMHRVSVSLRDVLLHDRWGEVLREEGKPWLDGRLVVAWNGAAYLVAPDLCFVRSRRGYVAVGQGEPFVGAALFATRDLEMSPVAKVGRALEAAVELCVAVRAPFEVRNLDV